MDRRTELIEQQVSCHPAIPMCPAETAERLVAASLEPEAVASAQNPTQLLATRTAGGEGGIRSKPPTIPE
jgi:hypothetical protein